jgi:hypothetical protein
MAYPSVYPGSLDSYTTKTDNVDNVMAVDVNELQSAIVAIETKLGIGTPLSVPVTIRSTGSSVPSSGAGAEILYNANIGYFTAYDRTFGAVKACHFGGDGATGIRVSEAGNVGINLAVPTNKLDINGGLRVQGAVATDAVGAGVEINYSSGIATFYGFNRAGSVYLPTAVDGLTFTINTVGTPRVTISGAGAVKVASLAGAGSRTVVAAADGTLSAP